VDSALTAFGDWLRTPEVQEGARRTVAGLSAAVEASIEEFGKRARWDRQRPGADRLGNSISLGGDQF
jgi:hypothetical protein